MAHIIKSAAIPVTETEGMDRYDDVSFEHSPAQLAKFKQLSSQQFLFQSENNFTLRIEIQAPKIWRITYTYAKDLETAPSGALDAERVPFRVGKIKVKEGKKYITLRNEFINCEIAKKDFSITLKDQQDGRLLCQDKVPFRHRSSIEEGTNSIQIEKESFPEEAYFGLGDKSCALNMRGKSLQNWNTDAFGFNEDADPLYRSIPFYYSLHQGKAYGIFLHNTHRSYFDFDSEKTESCRIAATGGELDYFFLYGPELLEVAKQYHWLTGKPELPPLWSLGFHQCRWSYYPDKRVLELADMFREQQIPCDAIYLDIDYMDGYRCFTWNKEYFPNPGKMIKKIAEKGFQTIVMIDPGIRVDEDYKVYAEGISKDYFCRRTTGELMKGPVWPPECVFPDYTSKAVRKWWGGLYKKLYLKDGVSGFWNDMNEPAVFKVNSKTFPNEVMHDGDGHPATHKEIHNIYGLLMSKASFEGLKKLNPEKRPFLLTRASFSGGQRFAAVWTGDNYATWEDLRLANIQCQRLSISGFSFTGTDIGGFADMPDGELFVRWLQLGIFHPLFRVHSMGNKTGGDVQVDEELVKKAEEENRLDQEPWAFGDPYTDQARAAIELRYRLLGYLYTAFWENVTTGNPILKSLSFYDQEDPETAKRENEFIFGNDLLVVPITRPKQKRKLIYLPAGEWYDFHTHRKYQGGEKLRVGIRAQYIPLFAKAGTILPLYPVQQHTGEKKIKHIDLKIFVAETGSGNLYEDAGEGYKYQKGKYLLREFTLGQQGNTYQLQQQTSGKYKSDCKSMTLHFIGLEKAPNSVYVDGKEYTVEEKEGGYIVEVPSGFVRCEF